MARHRPIALGAALALPIIMLTASAGGAAPAVVPGPAAAPAAQASAPETVRNDSLRATPAGATFTVPAGWTMTTKGSMVVLDTPETDSHVAIIDVQAKDAEGAVEAAWAAYRPGFDRPLKISLAQTARNGWDERKSFNYETSPNERVVVAAFAWRVTRSCCCRS